MRLVPERHDSDLKADRIELYLLEAKHKNWRGMTFKYYDEARSFMVFMDRKGVKTWLYHVKSEDGNREQVVIDDRDPLKALRAIDAWK
jgi:hypothetical protein